MKRLLLVFLILFTLTNTTSVLDAGEETYPVVYFYTEGCLDCITIEEKGLLETLEAQGVDIETYDVHRDGNEELYLQYAAAYDTDKSYPILFAGEDYYHGVEDIENGVEEALILESAQDPLRDVEDIDVGDIFDIEGVSGFLRVVAAGLIDGINPCAIAMMLMFITMLGFIKQRRALLFISISYILGIFLTYFAIGFFVLEGLRRLAFIETMAHILYALFAALCLFLFIITLQDYLSTRKGAHSKIKNQLLRRIRAFNERLMQRMTNVLKYEQKRPLKLFYLIGIPFIIGVIIGVTEAVCTGQIYIVVLFSLHQTGPIIGTIYLFIFNVLFILPLIIIAAVAIKSKDATRVSLFIHKHTSKIKLITSLFFLFMLIYFITQLLGLPVFGPTLFGG